MRRRWSGLPRSLSPAAARRRSEKSCSTRSYSAKTSSLYRAVYVRRDARSSTPGSGTSSTRTACPQAPAGTACDIEPEPHLSPSELSNHDRRGVSREVDREGCEKLGGAVERTKVTRVNRRPNYNA